MVGDRVIDLKWAKMIGELGLDTVIEAQGFVDISSEQFNSMGLEIRLMTKIDHIHQRPKVFQDLGLNILTRGRNLWRVGKFETQTQLPESVPPSSDVRVMTLPDYVESLVPSTLSSESSVLNAAQLAGVVDDFLDGHYSQTISGRMSSGDFSFRLQGHNGQTNEISVSKAQIEIDAGFESRADLALFEAKMSTANDFCTRQLYYPFRVWGSKLPHKPVRNVYLSYANEFLDLFEFEFAVPDLYSSAHLVRRQRYTLGSTLPTRGDVDELASQLPHADPPMEGGKFIPFPQADSFEKVIELAAFISEAPRRKIEIAEHFGFDPRQADYYPNAAAYLGIARKALGSEGEKVWVATAEGRRIIALPLRERSLAFAKLLLQLQPVSDTFEVWRRTGQQPSREWVVAMLTSSPFAVQENGSRLGQITISRRASTITAWASWLISLRS